MSSMAKNINLAHSGALEIIKEMSQGKAPKAIQNIAMAANRNVLNSTKDGILFRHRPATLSNGFTGIGLTKTALGLGVAGIVIKGAYDGFKSKKGVDQSFQPQGEDMGTISSMSIDAQGSVINGNRTLSATGDLVFGLHRMDRR